MMKKNNLTRELDLYIEKNYRSEGVDLEDIIGWGLGDLRGFGGHPRNMGWALDFFLKKMELSFSEKLMQLIEHKGRKPSEVYSKAGITKNLFSKIKNDNEYHPTKETALAFAVALHLDLDETADLLKRAGYTLSHSSESDLIVEFFIERGIYNIDEINNQLDCRGHKPLTNWRRSADE